MPDASGPAGSLHWRPRPQRASRYFLVLVLVICLSGAWYLWRGVGTRTVYVAAVDLPAFHQMTEADVRAVAIRSSSIPDHSVVDRANLVGHYTLTNFAQDGQLVADQIGPQLAAGTISRRRVTALAVATADVQGVLGRGDEADLLLSGTGGRSTSAGIVRQALILNVTTSRGSDGEKQTVTCAILATDEKTLLSVGADTRILAVRTSSYALP